MLVYMISRVNQWRCVVSPDQLEEVFRSDMPEGFLYDVMALFQQAYPEARERVKPYAPPEARDLQGDIRRAIIEESLRDIAARYPGLRATVQQNKQQTQWYTEIRSGRMVLTVSCRPYPRTSLRPADFRSRYARVLQHTIKEIREDLVMEDGAVFAVLVHGPQMSDQGRTGRTGGVPTLDWSQLGFAFAGFPTVNFRSWEAKIDLLAAYGRQIVAQGVEEETIEATFSLNLRQDADEGKSGMGA